MKKLIFIFLLISCLIYLSSHLEKNTIKVINNENGELYEIGGEADCRKNLITINGFNNYRIKLVHELTHILCYRYFNDCDIEHTRCFTENYNLGRSWV